MSFFKGSNKYYKKQKYYELKKKYEKENRAFIDPEFDKYKLKAYLQDKLAGSEVVWMRPESVVKDPIFITKDKSIALLVPGKYGIPWFSSLCCLLKRNRTLLEKVVPDLYQLEELGSKQSHFTLGIFRFNFWRMGFWHEVVIDDTLPTVDKEFIFCHCHSKQEYWVSLLEKAYAKFNGSYAELAKLSICDAMVEFCGGVINLLHPISDHYGGSEKKEQFFTELKSKIDDQSMIVFEMLETSSETSAEQKIDRTAYGLQRGHPYAVTGIKSLSTAGTSLLKIFSGKVSINLIKLRNPIGFTESPDGDKPVENSNKDAGEGVFMYSTNHISKLMSKCPEWSKLSEDEKSRLGLDLEGKEDIWMPIEDVMNYFNAVIICHVYNTSTFTLQKKWKEDVLHGGWSVGVKWAKSDKSGGGLQNTTTFFRNPQFRFDVTTDVPCQVTFHLSQSGQSNKLSQETTFHNIGLHIFKVEVNRSYCLHRQTELVCSEYVFGRNLFLTCTLAHGRYVVLATTYERDQTGQFVLRTFSENDIYIKELVNHGPRSTLLSCFKPVPHAVVTVRIKAIKNLQISEGVFSWATVWLYCILKCGGSKARTSPFQGGGEMTWNTSAIFYLKTLDSEITIDVYSKGMLLDDYWGQCTFRPKLGVETYTETLDMMVKKDKQDCKRGELVVEVQSTDDYYSA